MSDQRAVDRDRMSMQRFIGLILFALGTGLAFGSFLVRNTFSSVGFFIGLIIGLLIYGGLWLLIDRPTSREPNTQR